MKKLIFVIVIFLDYVYTCPAQPCFPDGLTLTSQEEVDSFQTDYPNCTEIEGGLIIKGDQGLFNLDGLNQLTSVGGDLIIHWSGLLNDITGLSGLTSIGGSLQVYYNWELTSLSGLENIDPSSISDLQIYGNPLLSDCTIQSLCDYLLSPNGVVDIYDNEQGCNNPGEIALQCGNTLPCLPFGNYYIFHQYEADSFYMYYPGCKDLEGNLLISGDSLENLESLIGLSSISGGLFVLRTKSLVNFQGLDSLTSIGNALIVGDWGDGNHSIENFKGLENLTSVGDIVNVFKNNSLTDFTGLNSLKSAYYFHIAGNENLISLEGLESLDSLYYSLSIGSNNMLSDLTALNNLRYVGTYISIENNDSLKSLAGIESIDTASIQWMMFNGNENLSDCAAQAICDFLADPTHIINLSENMEGCNTRTEIEEACLVSVNENEISYQLSVYPNPFTTSTTIEYQLIQPSEVTLTIFNHLGEQVELIRQHQSSGKQQVFWNAEGQAPGMYFFILKAGEKVATGKMVLVK